MHEITPTDWIPGRPCISICKLSPCRSKFGLLLLFNIVLFSSAFCNYPISRGFFLNNAFQFSDLPVFFFQFLSLAIEFSLHIYRLFLLIKPFFENKLDRGSMTCQSRAIASSAKKCCTY